MFRILALLTFLTAPAVATASPVAIRSGEHVGFSRIVVPIREGLKWSVEENEREVVLKIGDLLTGFDTSEVFDFIPRSRIANITSNNNSLTLILNCNCGVSYFVERDAYLVIDIATVVNEAEKVRANSVAFGFLEQITENIERTILSEEEIAPSPFPLDPPRPIERFVLNQVEEKVLNDAKDRLMRQMGISTSQGLLAPKFEELPNSGTKSSQNATLTVENIITVPADDDVRNLNQQNVRISSSRDNPARWNRVELDEENDICSSKEELNVPSWASTEPFAVQVGPLRRELFDERDRLDQAVAINLAKVYLYFGLGAEAKQVLGLFSEDEPADQYLVTISEILDGKTVMAAELMAPWAKCDSDISIWAFLSLSDSVDVTSLSVNASLRTLNGMPTHLRSFLAPLLSQKFLELGEKRGAIMALKSIDRLSQQETSPQKFAHARVALEEEGSDFDSTLMVEIVEQGDSISPIALITYINESERSETPIEENVTNLVGAYAVEFKGSELGSELRKAHVIALAMLNDFDRARAVFNDIIDLDDNTRVRLERAIISRLIRNANDVTYLNHVLSLKEQSLESLSVSELIGLTNRSSALGFTESAERVLVQIPKHLERSENKLVLARALLNLEQPNKVLTLLQDMSGEVADLLRAEAKQEVGDFVGAFDLFAKNGHLDSASEAAWLAKDWRNITPKESPTFGPLVELFGKRAVENEPIGGLLQYSNNILVESEIARGALSGFLNNEKIKVN